MHTESNSRTRLAPVDDRTDQFEALYAAAANGQAVVPWDREAPSPQLMQWARKNDVDGTGKLALVIGCGFGRDSEYIANLGFDTVAFDVSSTAIAAARSRHPQSSVEYVTADLFDLPGQWRFAFDLVVESTNVQALPEPTRSQAIATIPAMVAPRGRLIVIAFADADGIPVAGPPWPLTRCDINSFATDGLTATSVELLPATQDRTVHRWRAEFTR